MCALCAMDAEGREWTLTELRRAALRSLVPLAHDLARDALLQNAKLSREFRKLGDNLNEISVRGSPEVLDALFTAA